MGVCVVCVCVEGQEVLVCRMIGCAGGGPRLDEIFMFKTFLHGEIQSG